MYIIYAVQHIKKKQSTMKLLAVVAAIAVPALAWMPPASCPSRFATYLLSSSRRTFIESAVVASSLSILPSSAYGLVKGNAPPSKIKPMSDKPKCTNIDECEATRETYERELAAEQEQGTPPKTTAGGTRYRDFEDGNPDKGAVKEGDEVTIYYKVLKLGKRSYDGISGEGTVVFSRGTFLQHPPPL